MPFIETKTTVKISEEQERELKAEYGRAIELISGKSEEWLMLDFVGGERMAFKGTTEPDIAMLDVHIFGRATDGEYARLTEKLCEIASRILGIPKNRIYVKYTESEHWGWNGFNF